MRQIRLATLEVAVLAVLLGAGASLALSGAEDVQARHVSHYKFESFRQNPERNPL